MARLRKATCFLQILGSSHEFKALALKEVAKVQNPQLASPFPRRECRLAASLGMMGCKIATGVQVTKLRGVPYRGPLHYQYYLSMFLSKRS